MLISAHNLNAYFLKLLFKCGHSNHKCFLNRRMVLLHVLGSDKCGSEDLIWFWVAITKSFHFVCRVLRRLCRIVREKENLFA